MPTPWGKMVIEGASFQTMRRLRKQSMIAAHRKHEERVKEFEAAWIQRQQQVHERMKNTFKDYAQVLTLEEYARLYVLNLGTWLAFTFWRDVRRRR
jgi:hypothetical protein